jgi:hypothetical protein
MDLSLSSKWVSAAQADRSGRLAEKAVDGAGRPFVTERNP